jgi:co-chaperonin GroES (HSP10)
MSVKFKPLKDRVFVSYTAELEKTAGGLYTQSRGQSPL